MPTRTRGRPALPSPRPACLLPSSSLSPSSPARPCSHPPPPPCAGLWFCPWPSGRGDPGQPRVSAPSLPGQDSPGKGRTAPAPDAARELAPPRGGATAAPPPRVGHTPLRPSPGVPMSAAGSEKPQDRFLSTSGALRSRVSRDLRRGWGFSYSRERRERAQGLKDGGRRGPGECLLKRHLRSSLLVPGPGSARVCLPGLRFPVSQKGGQLCRLFLGLHGLKSAFWLTAPPPNFTSGLEIFYCSKPAEN